jgi:uncharacterized protein
MWWTALIMGFAGSLHCAGMCSPLAMAVTRSKPFLLNKIIYNTGRIFTYGVLGSLAAGFGSLFMVTPYQGIVSLIIGSVFLLMGIGAIGGVRIPVVTAALNSFTNWLKGLFAFWLKKKNNTAMLIMGMLNGLLPCGLTYLAITYCFIMSSSAEGFLFMIVFGAGTWPVMIGFTWLLGTGFRKIKTNYRIVTSVVFILIGTWLVVRPLINHPLETGINLIGKNITTEVACP